MKQNLQIRKTSFNCRSWLFLLSVSFMFFTNVAVAQTTAIPDNNFEARLIALGLDTVADNLVLTANISSVTSLDVSGLSISNLSGIQAFASLQILNCNTNSISGNLDLSMLSNLTTVDIDRNQLTGINLTGLTNVTRLSLWINQLSSINVSTNTALTYLDVDKNQLSSINVTSLTALQTFYCSENLFTTLDVRGLPLGTAFECANNPRLSCILIDTVPSGFWGKEPTATYCTLKTYSGGAWTPAGAPTASNSAFIEGNYSAAGNITACSLTVKNNAVVTIPTGSNVNLTAGLTVEPGSSFTISNDANLKQTNVNSANTGVITVNRNSSALFRLDFTLWASPVAGTQTLANFSPQTSTNRFYTYSPSGNQYNLVSSALPFSAATGYLIRMPNVGTANYNAGTETLNYAGAFTGTPNNGNVSVTGLTANTFNAVGNPYPSTIDAALFLAGNTTDGTLYFWRKTNAIANTTSAYATWTTFGTAGSSNAPNNVAPDGTIAVGQGFVVRTGAATTTLNFTNTMRTTSNSSLFFKTNKIVGKSRMWLNLTNSTGAYSQALIGYTEGATKGFDKGFDGKYINDSPVALTSLIDNEEYTIQARPAFSPNDVVALNFKTSVAGDYTISIDKVDGLFASNQDIYLVDSKTGAETNLKQGAYTFTAAAGVDSSRFSLKYQKTLKVDSLDFNENTVQVYKSAGSLYVNAGAKAISSVQVYDVQGRLIASQMNVKATTAIINSLKNNSQVLIVRVTAEDNTQVTKKVIN